MHAHHVCTLKHTLAHPCTRVYAFTRLHTLSLFLSLSLSRSRSLSFFLIIFLSLYLSLSLSLLLTLSLSFAIACTRWVVKVPAYAHNKTDLHTCTPKDTCTCAQKNTPDHVWHMCTIKHTCTQAQQNKPALVWNKICLNQSYNSVERGVRGLEGRQPPCMFSLSSPFALFCFLSSSLLCTRKTLTSDKSSPPFLSKFRFAFRKRETRTMANHNHA